MNIIELKNINFSYNSSSEDAGFSLKDINLSITGKEFISIHGSNGSGKTTLLNLLTGYLSSDKGDALLLGKPIAGYSPKKLAEIIAFVPQKINTFFSYSIYEIVAMGRTPYLNLLGIESEKDHEIIRNTLEIMELSHLANKGINNVSGGEAQRAFIARALVQEPKIILLDEPSAHLDLKHQVEIYNILKRLNEEENKTIIIVSHDLNLSSYFTKRAIFMKDGEIYLDGNISDLYSEENIKEVFGIECDIKYTDDVENIPHIFVKPGNN